MVILMDYDMENIATEINLNDKLSSVLIKLFKF